MVSEETSSYVILAILDLDPKFNWGKPDINNTGKSNRPEAAVLLTPFFLFLFRRGDCPSGTWLAGTMWRGCLL